MEWFFLLIHSNNGGRNQSRMMVSPANIGGKDGSEIWIGQICQNFQYQFMPTNCKTNFM